MVAVVEVVSITLELWCWCCWCCPRLPTARTVLPDNMHTADVVDILLYRVYRNSSGDKGGISNGRSRSKSWGYWCTAAAASVLLAAEDAVAVVYGFLLFALPSNCRRIFMCTYTDCSSTQVHFNYW